MVKYGRSKHRQFITSFLIDKHIFVFSGSQPCLKFRQHAYRKCKFTKIGIEAGHVNSTALAFILLIGENFGRFVAMPSADCLRLLYAAVERR